MVSPIRPHLNLGTQFALSIILIFLITIVAGSAILTFAIHEKAEAEVAVRAEILIQTANSVRDYTSHQVAPEFEESWDLGNTFIPETVPAYAAREVFEHFRRESGFEDFYYREATLNPTNPRDLADEFEGELIEYFRQHPEETEASGYRNYQSMENMEESSSSAADAEKWFYIARPLKVTEPNCLSCHGNPADAPKSLIDKYGSEGGFHWELGEVISAQTIYVPSQSVFAHGQMYIKLVVGVLICISLAVFIAFRLLLQNRIVTPLRKLTEFTRSIGTFQQNIDNPHRFNKEKALNEQARRSDEIGVLAKAFKKMIDEIRIREMGLTEMVQARTAALSRSSKVAEASRQQAERANQAKSQFLANMSHEFRTPLNAILGFAQIMNRDRTLSKPHQKHLGTILRSGEHLLGLIDDVLDMSKIEAGQIVLDRKEFNLNNLLDDIESMFQLRCKEVGIELIFNRASEIPDFIEADEGKLKQVLINVLGNAVKFTKAGNISVYISSNSQVGHPSAIDIHFEVSDTGPGISQADIDDIFETFVQIKSTRMAHKGAGLGLSISRQFVRVMGGEMTVTSQVGLGSCFRWNIPAKQVTPPQNQSHPNRLREVACLLPQSQPCRILAIDDSVENRELLSEILTPLGFEVKEVPSGVAGISCWQDWMPHLILMDIRMDEMDGMETTRQIRALEGTERASAGHRTVIIALTASALAHERQMALDSGCDDFMRKPFMAKDLLEKIAFWLGVEYSYHADLEHKADRTSNELESNREPETSESQLQTDVPSEWFERAEAAARRLDYSELVRLVDSLEAPSSNLVKRICLLLENFDYDGILEEIASLTDRSE